MKGIKLKGSISPADIFLENRESAYLILFYVSGLLVGAFTFKSLKSDITEKLISVLAYNSDSFRDLLINRASVYMTVFAATVILGLCVIGFPIINAVPLLCGASIGLKTAYYYSANGFKGFGYSMLLIIPQSALFITVIIFTCGICTRLSREIFSLSIKKSDITGEQTPSSYLKIILLYAVFTALTALFNALTYYLFAPLIKLG